MPGSKEKRRRRGAVLGVILILVALAAAGGGATILTRYMDARVSAARVPTAKIVTAKLDIPLATPLKEEWLELVDWPIASRPPGAVSEVAPLLGRVAVVPIARGEALLASKLVDANARSGLATLLPATMRAASVRVDDVVGVAGFIHPGDFVDVLVTMKPKDDGPFVSKIVLQNVKVLAVGKDLTPPQKDANKATPATVATLMVSSDDSEKLALAAAKGQILLTLRGLGDEELVATTGITPPALLLPPRHDPPAAPAAPAAKPAVATRRPNPAPVPAAAPAPKQVVEILRGDLYEKRNFDSQARP